MRRGGCFLCLVLAFVGCAGNGGGHAAPLPTSSIAFVADRNTPLRWTKKTYRTEAGRVQHRVIDPSQGPHSVGVEKSQKCCKQRGDKQFGTSKTVSTGETTRTVVELSPGRHWAYCGVDGHWQGGMVSRLIVK
jgi:sulfocyanin SoxE-like protein